ncbi:MAG: hypothetical protein IAE98_11935, partial [Candidatus Kapabacteria bacterium]|nr:hypothetical protein [Candidatus Kapabacteria bacterium]
MKKVSNNITMKFATFFVVAFALSAFLINSTFAQSGLPCEPTLGYPEVEWNDGGPLDVYPSSIDCPGNCKITFEYKHRYVQTMLGWRRDIIITKITRSAGCANCDFNEFRLMLWGIWVHHADIDEWIDPGTNQYSNRYSAASCWRYEFGPMVEAYPCSSECCSQYYNVSRTTQGIIYFWMTEPTPITNNCTEYPCNYFICDKLSNISMTEEESSPIYDDNPGLGGWNKQSLNPNDKYLISVNPNPATQNINLNISGLYDNFV